MLRVRGEGGGRDVARVALGAEWRELLPRRASRSTRSTAGSTARRGAAARTRSGSAVAPTGAATVERDRARRRRRSATRRPRSGSTPRRRARPRPAARRARRRAGTRRGRERSSSASGAPRCASSATRVCVESTQPTAPCGTRQIEPALARSAFGEVGSAQPSERAIAAPNASAVRISVPTLPGIGEPPERERRRRAPPSRQVGSAVDGDHPRRMRGARDVGEQLRLDVLAGAQQVDRLGGRGLDRVLALDEEEAELVAPAPVVQLADELQPLVVPARRSQRDCIDRRIPLGEYVRTWPTCSPRSPSRTGATSWTRCATAKRQSARSSPTSRWRNLRSRSTCACSARWASSGHGQTGVAASTASTRHAWRRFETGWPSTSRR